ncbi:MAG TPA: recombinase family protein, partial [Candidatus Pacearchaeota archaeon]|nr:recombinase family protein [Candidatus Pacearchaeota archaeon]
GFEIAKVFSFDESAYKTKRDDFDKTLEYIKSTKEKIAVCFDKVDRFSRNIFDKRVASLYDLAMQDKIELHFASDNLTITPNISATEKFHFGINLGLAKYYSDAISDNVKRVYEKKIRDGEWIGKAPIGYNNITENNGTKNIIPDPTRAHLIVRIFEEYATGNCSVRQIRYKMEKLGLKGTNKKHNPISNGMIYNVLKNPFYYGEMQIKTGPLKGLYPHKYQPLISNELFDKCQEVMTNYHKKPFKYAGKPFVLRGMVKCAECGCTITPETSKGHIYYSCTNYKRMHPKRIYVREEKLLEPVYEVLKNIQLSDDKIQEITEELKKSNEAKNAFHKKSLASLRNEYDKIETRINNAFDLLTDGSITRDMFNKKLKEYKEKQAELNEEMQRYTDADENYYITANIVLNLAKKAYEIFQSSEVEEKRQLLNFLLQNLTLEGKKLNFELKTPFDTVLQTSKCSTGLRR